MTFGVPSDDETALTPLSPTLLEEVAEGIAAASPVVDEIRRLLQVDPSPPLVQLALVTSRSSTLTARILRQASGGQGSRAAESIEQALARIGIGQLAKLLSEIPTYRPSEMHTGVYRLSCLSIERWAKDCSDNARAISWEIAPARVEPAALAGRLCDLGMLIIDAATVGSNQRRPAGFDTIDWESEVFGITHPDLGAWLGRRWGFSEEIVRAIEDHHAPEPPDDEMARSVWLGALLSEALAKTDLGIEALHAGVEACGLNEEWLDRHLDMALVGTSKFSDLPDTPAPLSQRQLDVFRLFAAGHDISEVAELLGVTQSTVNNHTWRAYRRLNVADRAQALFLLREQGWI